MKILHILDSGKSGINGITNVVIQLSYAQRILGNDVFVGLTRNSTLINDEFFFIVDTVVKFKYVLKLCVPDIVVFHSLYNMDYIYFANILLKKCIPYLIVFHGGASSDNYKKHYFKKVLANIIFFNRFVKKAAKVIYLNKAELSKSIFQRINNKYSIIPNGIVLNNIDLEKKVLTLPLTITFISRMDIYGKGLDVLMKVIAILYKSEYNCLLRFLFYGYSYEGSHHIIDGYGDFAQYGGVVYGKDKDAVFRNTDMVILPSRSEGMPLTILEAFSYGVPCIVTPQTNMSDLIELNQAGWVTNLDVQEMVDCIKKAYGEYIVNYETYRKSCLMLAQRFDWSNIAQQSIKIYSDVLCFGNKVM